MQSWTETLLKNSVLFFGGSFLVKKCKGTSESTFWVCDIFTTSNYQKLYNVFLKQEFQIFYCKIMFLSLMMEEERQENLLQNKVKVAISCRRVFELLS